MIQLKLYHCRKILRFILFCYFLFQSVVVNLIYNYASKGKISARYIILKVEFFQLKYNVIKFDVIKKKYLISLSDIILRHNYSHLTLRADSHNFNNKKNILN